MFRIKVWGINFFIRGAMVPLMILMYFSGYLREYVRIYSYITLHELFHGITALALGSQVEAVEITPGGLRLGLSGEEQDRKKKILILIVGPAANLLLALIFHILHRHGAAQANLALALFNLLPVRPLDGHEILTTIFRSEKAEIAIGLLGKLLLGGMACLLVYGFLAGRGSIISAITFLFMLSHFPGNGMEGKILRTKNLFGRRRQFLEKGYYEGRILTVLSTTKIGKILSSLGHDSFHFIFVLDENFMLKGILTEQQVLDWIVNEKSHLTFGELLSEEKPNEIINKKPQVNDKTRSFYLN